MAVTAAATATTTAIVSETATAVATIAAAATAEANKIKQGVQTSTNETGRENTLLQMFVPANLAYLL